MAGLEATYEEIIDPCDIILSTYIRADCFFQVLAIDFAKTCNAGHEDAMATASLIWRYVYDRSR